jgi:hypothetical protein
MHGVEEEEEKKNTINTHNTPKYNSIQHMRCLLPPHLVVCEQMRRVEDRNDSIFNGRSHLPSKLLKSVGKTETGGRINDEQWQISNSKRRCPLHEPQKAGLGTKISKMKYLCPI